MKKISIVTPCFNEEENVEEAYRVIKDVFKNLKQYTYEHIFIDNASKDNTVNILKKIAAKDKNVKIIVNVRNFGPNRSPFYGLTQATGDAVMLFVADLQDPPELIEKFISKWEEGNKVVIGIKNSSEENFMMFQVRKLYYWIMRRISESEHLENFSGFGLYDRSFIDILKNLTDAYPYFRGLVGELSFDRAEIKYTQPKRKKGKSSHHFFVLYDIAMNGLVSQSKVPLRLAIFIGFIIATLSLVVAFVYLIYKLVFWSSFNMGIAPLVIGLFFFSSIQLFFIGIVGEYTGAIYTQVKSRPIVIERERVNFD